MGQDTLALVTAFDDEDYKLAASIARGEAEEAADLLERLVFKALADWAWAMEEWMVSYDGPRVRKCLRRAQRRLREFVLGRSAELSAQQRDLLRVCRTLNRVTRAELIMENAEVTSDSSRLSRNAGRAAAIAAAAPSLAMDGRLAPLADWLTRSLAAGELRNRAIALSASVVERRDELSPEEFELLAGQVREAVGAVIADLPDADLSTRTHLRMHQRFLDLHAALARADTGRLRLRDGRIVSFVSWKIRDHLVDQFADRIKDGLEVAQLFLGEWVSEAPFEPAVMDLYRTPVGRQLVGVVSVPAGSVTVDLCPGMTGGSGNGAGRGRKTVEVPVELRLHRFGVCSVHFEFAFDALSVREVREIQCLVTPHAAPARFRWRGEPYKRLRNIVDMIEGAVRAGLEKFVAEVRTVRPGEQDEALRTVYLPYLTWFTYVWSPWWTLRRNGEEETVKTVTEVLEHPDLVGLALGPREARATIDDWLAGPRPPFQNLAPVRSHVGDLMLVTENHAVLFYPDDPYYLLTQFAETVELVAKLRCLAICLNYEAQDEIGRVYEQAGSLRGRLAALYGGNEAPEQELDNVLRDIEQHRMKAVEFRNATSRSLELIGMSTTSQYQDHAHQTRQAMEAAGIPPIIAALDKKLEMIRADLDAIAAATGIATERSRTKREKAREGKAKARGRLITGTVVVIGAAQVLTVLEEALKLIVDPVPKALTFGVLALMLLAVILLLVRDDRAESREEQ